MTLSKNKIKYIRSLELKKNRKAEGVFLAEGSKLVGELAGHLACPLLVGTKDWLAAHPSMKAEEIIEASAEELARASLLRTPQEVLAVFRQREEALNPTRPAHALCLALDGVQDPGNLGTIVRLADWFGIEDIFCSPDTADVYNPKTVQATMGGLARVKVHYTPLVPWIASLETGTPVYGTFLNGTDIYAQSLENHGLIIMGNEGNGIRPEVERLVNKRLYVPNYPAGRETSESLNVAIATAIVCAEFRRQAASR